MSNTSKPIIVAGAGAVGLSLALALAKKNVAVHVLELRDSPNMASKASTFHASTLDILGKLGVLDAFMAQATRIDAMQYRSSENEILAELNFSDLAGSAENPVRMHLEQSVLCEILLKELRGFSNAQITFNCGVSDIIDADCGLQVVCDTSEGRKTYEASYVFGCDGAASSVREALKIGFVEKPYPGYVLRLYAEEDLAQYLPGLAGVSYIFNGDDSCSLLKMSDCWRIVVRVPPEVPHDVAMGDEWIIGRLNALLPIEAILPHVTSRDVYGAKRRRALSARAGRCFLAGDALHLTNTRGGMNLNAGIHDAFALAAPAAIAWKTGNEAALNQAADERERVAREILLPRTDSNIGTGQERLQRIRKIAQDPALALTFLTEAAMLDMSPLHGMKEASQETMSDPIGKPRIGVVVPPANPAVEPEMRLLLADGAIYHATRLPVFPNTTLYERNELYLEAYPATLKTYGALKLAAISIAMTGSSYKLLPAGDEQMCRELSAQAGVPVVTASLAIFLVLKAMEARKIAMISPYPKELTEKAVDYWTAGGFEIGHVHSTSEEFRAYDLNRDEISEAIAAVPLQDIDVAIMSGTGAYTIGALEKTAGITPVPILTSNLCSALVMSALTDMPLAPLMKQLVPSVVEPWATIRARIKAMGLGLCEIQEGE